MRRCRNPLDRSRAGCKAPGELPATRVLQQQRDTRNKSPEIVGKVCSVPHIRLNEVT